MGSMKDLTQGNVYRNLTEFAVPILLGNLLQLTYNAVDSIVVGRYASEAALAAVGICGPVMSIVILGASGISIGASAFMGQCYGAKKMKQLKQAFASVMLLSLVMAFAILAVCMIFCHPLLMALQVPQEAYSLTEQYLRIVLLSFPFTFLYNVLTASLRSVGDSKTPIIFLGISCAINIVLDVILVRQFHMSAAGAAIATLFAEGISCVLCLAHVYRNVPVFSLKKGEWTPDRQIMRTVLKNGSITAFQQLMQPIGKVLIQGCINGYGVSVIAAFNAVNRVDDFACIPEQSISHAIMNYTSQCDGAGNKEKMKEGFRKGMILEIGYGILIFLAIFWFRGPIIRLFGSGSMTNIGTDYLKVMAVFYILPAITNGIQGFFRGIQRMKVTFAATCIQITLRVIFVYLLLPRIGMNGAAYACAVGWTVMIGYQIVKLAKLRREVG